MSVDIPYIDSHSYSVMLVVPTVASCLSLFAPSILPCLFSKKTFPDERLIIREMARDSDLGFQFVVLPFL